jgi:hypothetical protein
MIGLKTYLSQLSEPLGQSEELLYERQRALVRQGLLESVGGRGPGSGVRADEKALAAFLISFLAHDILSHASVAEFFCEMKPISPVDARRLNSPVALGIPGRLERAVSGSAGKCPFTGARTFRGAVEAVLGHEPLAFKTWDIEIHRNGPGGAFLSFRDKNNKSMTSEFRNKPFFNSPLPVSVMHATTSLHHNFILQIAKDIVQFKKDAAT